MSTAEQPPDERGLDRRKLLRYAGVGAATAWATPTLLSSPAAAGPGTGLDSPIRIMGSGAWFQTTDGTSWFTSSSGGSSWSAITDADAPVSTTLAVGSWGRALATNGTDSALLLFGAATPVTDADFPSNPTVIAGGGANPTDGAFIVTDGTSWARSTGATTWEPVTDADLPAGATLAAAGGTFVSTFVVTNGSAWARSGDAGASWSAVASPPFTDPVRLAGGDVNFVATSTTSWARSADGGVTWTAVASPPFANPNFLAGGGSNFVAIRGANWAYSTDGGATWTAVAAPPFTDAVALAGGSPFGSGNGFVVTNGSLWRRSDTGATWLAAANPF
jgi:hypothetical protein